MDEDDETYEDPLTFDSGNFPNHIDTLDQNDSDVSLGAIGDEED